MTIWTRRPTKRRSKRKKKTSSRRRAYVRTRRKHKMPSLTKPRNKRMPSLAKPRNKRMPSLAKPSSEKMTFSIDARGAELVQRLSLGGFPCQGGVRRDALGFYQLALR